MCVLVKGKKKVIKRNDVPYTRMVEHYGEFPAVMIAPGDMELIGGGSEERRRWLDGTISLEDREYLYYLMRYEKALQQRNAELRKMDEQPNRQLLQVYDQMLLPLAEQIHARRKVFIEAFLPYFNRFHAYIAEGQEEVRLEYQSSLHTQSLAELLESNFRKDLALQRTTSGIHRDDIEFYIGGSSLKRFGSQGQQKTFLLALKLAQHQYIKEKKGFAPLLLLDDVCERLDEKRLSLLFRLIQNGGFGQVFVTDSSMARISNLLQGFAEYRIFEIEKGKVITDEV
jgi:DNA replication and repair protein RecF